MSPEAQRLAIAEACGWKKIGTDNSWNWELNGEDMGTSFHDLPDYLSDLNAMHEAEEVLLGKLLPDMDGHPSLDAWTWYERALMGVSIKTKDSRAWHATAAQRAEAFLRTIGKWDDSARSVGARKEDKA